MNEFIDNIIKWFEKTFEPVADFFYTYRDHPLLWIGLLVVGLVISKLTYEALNKSDF